MVGFGLSINQSTVSFGPSINQSTVSFGPSINQSTVSFGPSINQSTFSFGPSINQSTVSFGPSINQSMVGFGPSINQSNVSVWKYDSPSVWLLQYLTDCVFIQFVCLLGILGNVLTLMVLLKDGRTSSTNMLLTSMTLVHLLTVLTTPIRRANCVISLFDPDLAAMFYLYQFCYLSAINRLTAILSTSHVALISVERFMAVYYPFHVTFTFSQRKTLTYILLTYMFWLGLSLPYFFSYQLTWTHDVTNRSVPALRTKPRSTSSATSSLASSAGRS
ncbi:neuromedin-U receptor 2-like [Physella acuta]|uniref:neuromedin-U receptor 2-like n=1 Tax=Physella acuta TaxID=109671 RepID=UPI0027DC5A0C|nr:neuromedin-U receptor 2-like [Physella acuta]